MKKLLNEWRQFINEQSTEERAKAFDAKVLVAPVEVTKLVSCKTFEFVTTNSLPIFPCELH